MIFETSAVVFGFITIFALASGLIVLWRRGRDDLDAWGLFISRVLRGDSRPARNPPHDHRAPGGSDETQGDQQGTAATPS